MSDKGLTLLEMIIAISLSTLLMGTSLLLLRPILLAWAHHQDRLELQQQVQHGMEKTIRQIRLAGDAQGGSGAIRFTISALSGTQSYILYLYHPSDSWPPSYSQASYQLRQAPLVGGINGTFTYGAGALLMREVVPPPASTLSLSGKVALLNLSLKRGDETFRLIERAKRRN